MTVPLIVYFTINALCVPAETLKVASAPGEALPSTSSSTETVIFLPFEAGTRIGARSFASITNRYLTRSQITLMLGSLLATRSRLLGTSSGLAVMSYSQIDLVRVPEAHTNKVR
jgi:hypothetical protein